MGRPLIITEANMDALFCRLARCDVGNTSTNMELPYDIPWNVYYVAVEGLGALRVLTRELFTDPQEALVAIDVDKPYKIITPEEFTSWCLGSFGLPGFLIQDLFRVLDVRRERNLTITHVEYLVEAQMNHRLFGVAVSSALGSPVTAFDKAESHRMATAL